ncbi:MAG: hypothetical protein KAH48_06685, partial [Chlorobi bacterium]|nr:hypothetical protein [Chlorobiota bacterium]
TFFGGLHLKAEAREKRKKMKPTKESGPHLKQEPPRPSGTPPWKRKGSLKKKTGESAPSEGFFTFGKVFECYKK